MAREISMNGRKKIESIQKEFTEKFNYLTLIFLDEDMKSIDVSRSLAEVRTAKGPDISIMASLKVNTLEQRFMDSFGITVEVAYSKDGKVIHTKDSVNKTLNELNQWCEKTGCDMFIFKKALTRNTLLSTQEKLFNAIKESFPDAEAKKINKDNFLDIHLQSIHPKRGSHLFFNTAKSEIKLGFYVRDESFISLVVESASNIEQYSQGLRISGNPTFSNVEDAIEAAIGFIGEIMRENSAGFVLNVNPSIASYVSAFEENPDPICDLLDSLGTDEGKMSVYKVDFEILSNLEPGDIPETDDLEFVGEAEINDWEALAEIIGEEEAEANKKEYSNDDLTEISKIIFLYCNDEYVYSFLNPGEEEVDNDFTKDEEGDESYVNDNNQILADFNTIKIGSQEWMNENLNLDKFRNGEKIFQAKTIKDWENAAKSGKPAWCNYENKIDTEKKYGKLYNWYAVSDPRGLAPEGWCIPNYNDWKKLIKSTGGNLWGGGKKLKSIEGWTSEQNGENEFGFNGLPAGCRWEDGDFLDISLGAYWWTASEVDDFEDEDLISSAYYTTLEYSNEFLEIDQSDKGRGYSVRCIKSQQ